MSSNDTGILRCDGFEMEVVEIAPTESSWRDHSSGRDGLRVRGCVIDDVPARAGLSLFGIHRGLELELNGRTFDVRHESEPRRDDIEDIDVMRIELFGGGRDPDPIGALDAWFARGERPTLEWLLSWAPDGNLAQAWRASIHGDAMVRVYLRGPHELPANALRELNLSAFWNRRGAHERPPPLVGFAGARLVREILPSPPRLDELLATRAR